MVETKQVDLVEAQVKALRAVLTTSDEIIDEVETQLPENSENAKIELENKHQEVVAALLEAYQAIYNDELPEDREYHADFDVVRDVQSKVIER